MKANIPQFVKMMREAIITGRKNYVTAIRKECRIGHSTKRGGITKEWLESLDWRLSDEELEGIIREKAKEGGREKKKKEAGQPYAGQPISIPSQSINISTLGQEIITALCGRTITITIKIN